MDTLLTPESLFGIALAAVGVIVFARVAAFLIKALAVAAVVLGAYLLLFT